MSQIKFKTTTEDGMKVLVVAGWDRPLQEYFMTVYSEEDPDAEDDDAIVWTALDDHSPDDAKGTHRLREKLVELKISVPDRFWAEVEKQEGNVVKLLPKEPAEGVQP